MASDGGGSIRIPASFTGLIGLKPSRGRIPVGPNGYRGWQGASVNFALTKTVRDTRRLLEVLQVEQMESPFILPKLSKQQLYAFIERPLKIAVIEDSPIGNRVEDSAKNALNRAVNFLQEKGHAIEKIQWPVDGIEVMNNYYMMNSVETAAMMDGIEKMLQRPLTKEDMELMTWGIYQSGQHILAKDYSAALNQWDYWTKQMQECHEDYDVILTPCVNDVAPKHDQYPMKESIRVALESIEQYSVNEQQEIIWKMFEKTLELTPFTQLANITGQPAISLPIYCTQEGLPVGVQVMAAKGREDLLLQIAEVFEQEHQWNRKD